MSEVVAFMYRCCVAYASARGPALVASARRWSTQRVQLRRWAWLAQAACDRVQFPSPTKAPVGLSVGGGGTGGGVGGGVAVGSVGGKDGSGVVGMTSGRVGGMITGASGVSTGGGVVSSVSGVVGMADDTADSRVTGTVGAVHWQYLLPLWSTAASQATSAFSVHR